MSEVMMGIEESNHLLTKEKEKFEEACKKLKDSYERFMTVMEADQLKLAEAWKKMHRLEK